MVLYVVFAASVYSDSFCISSNESDTSGIAMATVELSMQTPMGQKIVSILVRCPHFRG